MEASNDSLPKLPLLTLFAMTFGYFGVNMAFSLQSSQMGRIFQTIGADPTKLGFFFILPPLAGMVVQPLIGKYSDKTWRPLRASNAIPHHRCTRGSTRHGSSAQRGIIRLWVCLGCRTAVWCHCHPLHGLVIKRLHATI